MGMGLAMSCAVGMATARARHGGERLQGNIEARGDTLRVRVYAGPNPTTGRTVSVRGTDDAARRVSRQTLNRLVAEADKGRRPSSVISLGHVSDEWLRVAEHEDSTREAYIERTIKPAPGSMSIAKLHTKLVDRVGRINPNLPVHEAARTTRKGGPRVAISHARRRDRRT